MATVRIAPGTWRHVEQHLGGGQHEERFAFLMCNAMSSQGRTVLVAHDHFIVPPEAVTVDDEGWEIAPTALDAVLNEAVTTGAALIEIHNHGGNAPRFSELDRAGIQTFAPYVLDTVPAEVYGAMVWAAGTVFGEVYTVGPVRGLDSDSIVGATVAGAEIRQLAPLPDRGIDKAVTRQVPWMTPAGQRTLESLRIGIVGASGNGTHIIQGLALLGGSDYVIVDDDHVDVVNSNRLVTSTPAETDMSKVDSARRWIRTHNPEARVTVVRDVVESAEAVDALRGVDVIFSCVDNDGARLVINRIAMAYGIPLVDVATGIDVADGAVEAAGGRLALISCDGPCLSCTDELDAREVSYYFAGAQQRRLLRQQGYAAGLDVPAPAVVSLNGLASHAALNEFTIWVSGAREWAPRIDIDTLELARPTGPWMAPRTDVTAFDGCVECSYRWRGDSAVSDLVPPS